MFHNTDSQNYLGSVEIKAELPLTVEDAQSLFGKVPHIGDIVFVEEDEDHDDSPSQYIIDDIDASNITWKFQYSIKIPGVTPPDGITIDKNASNELEVKDSGVSTIKIKPSTTDDQVLKTVSGSVVWANGSTDVTVDNSSIDFNSSSELEVKDSGITASKIANSAVTTDKIADTNVTTDKLINNAVTTTKILDKNVTPAKISPGSNDQVLKTVSGDVVWGNSSGDVNVDNTSIDFNLGDELEVKDAGIITSKIQDGAVITSKISDSNVTTVKLADNSVTTSKVVDSNITEPKLATNSVTTSKVVDANITEQKLASDSVTTSKVVDANITEPKLSSDSVTTAKIVDNAVTTAKILDKNITLPKIAVGTESQILRTVSGEAVWSTEVDITDKADKFKYTPAESTETTYNLDDIQTINIEGNGAGVNPNTGIVYTNFAGEDKTILIESDPGFFKYKGQVDTYEKLPEFDTVENGYLYSIAASIDFKGTVASMGDLPESPADYDQYFVTAPGQYVYWDSTVGSEGEWITNHCQFEDGCNNTGWYAFGVGGEPSWNRLDSELTVDQVLDTTSANAIANKAVAQALLTKLNTFSPNTLSEFFNENDGGGIVYYENTREVAGITLNTNCPQLYIHRYDEPGNLTNRVLVEVHDDGLYISTVLEGTSWIRIATMDDILKLFQEYTPDTSYNKNTILRHHTVDSTTYNRYGISTGDYTSNDFDTDVDAGELDEIVSMKELNDTLQYAIDNYFPTPVVSK